MEEAQPLKDVRRIGVVSLSHFSYNQNFGINIRVMNNSLPRKLGHNPYLRA
jgi:hypothetical protein